MLLAHALLGGLGLLDVTAAFAQEQRQPPDLTGIVKDPSWAAILGKALFWDTVALRSGGATCSGCHLDTAADSGIPPQSNPREQALRIADLRLRSWDRREISDAGTVFKGEDSSLTQAAAADGIVSAGEGQSPADDGVIASIDGQGPPAHPTETLDDPPAVGARLARAILGQQPLGAHTIDPSDNLLGSVGPHGSLVSPTGKGLDRTYAWLIQQAFSDTLWSEDAAAGADYRRLERNFTLFWALSMRVYEQTWSADIVQRHACIQASSTGESGCPNTLTLPAPSTTGARARPEPPGT